ncbi:MAG: sigma-70 family RNA polymerase sigma factor [Syntrophobacteraceae bacterium]|jgi:RNA polymerase sigma-70 factor (ECF subfamily)
MAKEEDRTDIAAFLSGDREGLDRLVLRHKDRIFNLCYRLLGDYSDAEECAQETFIKVFRSIKGFRFESSFSTWVYTIAVNICKNRRNSAEHRFWKRVLRFVQNSPEEESPADFEIEDPAPSPLVRMTERETEIMLQTAINSLSHDHRTVIVLRHVEGLSYEEISAITGYNIGTLKSKLARARLLLQNKLRGGVEKR